MIFDKVLKRAETEEESKASVWVKGFCVGGAGWEIEVGIG
jgi:hypothetical protein